MKAKEAIWVAKEKNIETPELTIKGNIIRWPGMMIQLSNVSSVSTTSLELQPFPVLALILLFIGLISFTTNLLLGIVVMAAGIVWIAMWWSSNEERKTTRNLNLMLNSGLNICIRIKDLKFLERVLGVLEQILINGGIGDKNNISINIQNSRFEGNAQVLNDLGINS